LRFTNLITEDAGSPALLAIWRNGRPSLMTAIRMISEGAFRLALIVTPLAVRTNRCRRP
jgi:hypothetical protein